MIKAIIFDMDGVVVDSEPIHRLSASEALKKYGIRMVPEEFTSYTGMVVLEIFERIKEIYNADFNPHHVKQEWDEQVKKHIKDHTPPTPGIYQFLEELQSHGYKIGLASSSIRELIMLKLASLGVLPYFKTIVGAEDVIRGKLDPELFLRAAENLNVDPLECVIIEDAQHGVTAAKAAGMRCIGYQNPHSVGQDLSAADKLITDFSEIDLSEFEKW